MQKIKEFISRNKSVFIIGTITLFVFLAIIVLAEQRQKAGKSQQPGLAKIGPATDAEEMKYYNVTQSQDPAVPPQIQEEMPQSTESQAVYPYTKEQESAFDQKYGVLDISYTDKGWVPKNYNSVVGQLVRWTNKTDKTIQLKQKMPLYNELTNPVLIEPGKTFSFRMYKNRLWTYEEATTKNFGSLYLLDEITK